MEREEGDFPPPLWLCSPAVLPPQPCRESIDTCQSKVHGIWWLLPALTTHARLESLPVELQVSIYGFASLSFVKPSADSPRFDHLALTCHSAENRETKLALCSTSKSIRGVAEEFLYGYVSLNDMGVQMVAKLIREGKFDATRVRELKLVHHHKRNIRSPHETLRLLAEFLPVCTALVALDMSESFGFWSEREVVMNAKYFLQLWRAIPPSVKTMCVNRTCHIPFVLDEDTRDLESFLAAHPRICNWKITCAVDRSESLRVFVNAKLLSLRGFMGSIETEVARSALSGVTSLVLNGYHATGFEHCKFSNLKELTLGRLAWHYNINAIICASPSLMTLRCKVGCGERIMKKPCWAIHPQESGLEHVVLHIEVEMLVDSSWMEYMCPTPQRRLSAYRRWGPVRDGVEERKHLARDLFFGLTDRTSFPRMKKITVVREWRSKQHPVWRAVGMRKIFKYILSFLGTERIQLVFASGQFPSYLQKKKKKKVPRSLTRRISGSRCVRRSQQHSASATAGEVASHL